MMKKVTQSYFGISKERKATLSHAKAPRHFIQGARIRNFGLQIIPHKK